MSMARSTHRTHDTATQAPSKSYSTGGCETAVLAMPAADGCGCHQRSRHARRAPHAPHATRDAHGTGYARHARHGNAGTAKFLPHREPKSPQCQRPMDVDATAESGRRHSRDCPSRADTQRETRRRRSGRGARARARRPGLAGGTRAIFPRGQDATRQDRGQLRKTRSKPTLPRATWPGAAPRQGARKKRRSARSLPCR